MYNYNLSTNNEKYWKNILEVFFVNLLLHEYKGYNNIRIHILYLFHIYLFIMCNIFTRNRIVQGGGNVRNFVLSFQILDTDI